MGGGGWVPFDVSKRTVRKKSTERAKWGAAGGGIRATGSGVRRGEKNELASDS